MEKYAYIYSHTCVLVDVSVPINENILGSCDYSYPMIAELSSEVTICETLDFWCGSI